MVRVCMLLLDILFVKITKIYETSQALLPPRTITQKNIIQSVFQLTLLIQQIKLVNAYIAISASRCGEL